MERPTSEDDYFWIRQWGLLMGSEHSAIEREVAKARRDKAPHNAIYREEQPREGSIVGVWRTTSGITEPDRRTALERTAGRRLPEEEETGG